jgi:hypothetical protein
MTYADVDDSVLFRMVSPREDEDETLRLLLNYESKRWELWFDGQRQDGSDMEAITDGRIRIRLNIDGTFEVLEKKVRQRRISRKKRLERRTLARAQAGTKVSEGR